MRRHWLLAAAALLCAAVPARASIDAEVPGVFKGKSTLSPAGEVEIYRFPASRNMLFNVTVTAARNGIVPINFQLFDSTGDPVSISADFRTTTPTKIPSAAHCTRRK